MFALNSDSPSSSSAQASNSPSLSVPLGTLPSIDGIVRQALRDGVLWPWEANEINRRLAAGDLSSQEMRAMEILEDALSQQVVRRQLSHGAS